LLIKDFILKKSPTIFQYITLNFDLNVGLNRSIGQNTIKSYSYPHLTIEYFKRRKYKNPYLNITGNILYPINKNFLAGIQSGIYIYFLEEYISSAKRTTVSIPIQLTARYNLLTLKENSIGINLAAGLNFFKIYDRIEQYKNGQLLNASVFYSINKKNLLKIGIEKQIDNVSFYVYKASEYEANQIFKYKINRLSIALSYGIEL
jgi:hypothetical protein